MVTVTSAKLAPIVTKFARNWSPAVKLATF
jgi:hypothetical protein